MRSSRLPNSTRLVPHTPGTENQNKSVTQTVINTATARERTLAFNYASLALNNSFFLDNIVGAVKFVPVACVHFTNLKLNRNPHQWLPTTMKTKSQMSSSLPSTPSMVASDSLSQAFRLLDLACSPTVGSGSLAIPRASPVSSPPSALALSSSSHGHIWVMRRVYTLVISCPSAGRHKHPPLRRPRFPALSLLPQRREFRHPPLLAPTIAMLASCTRVHQPSARFLPNLPASMELLLPAKALEPCRAS